jgi:hypothetical protein
MRHKKEEHLRSMTHAPHVDTRPFSREKGLMPGSMTLCGLVLGSNVTLKDLTSLIQKAR